LEIKLADKNIANVLEMTIDDAVDFFQSIEGTLIQKVVAKLLTLQEVGLGYVHMGQAASTLSGGESQRVKLASYLTKKDQNGHLVFIFDEPTTGLHFHDIKKLLKAFNALIEKGHTLIIIEHNLDVIKNADWVIDLGPEGGQHGGNLLFQGKPEEMVECKDSYTAHYLKDKLDLVE